MYIYIVGLFIILMFFCSLEMENQKNNSQRIVRQYRKSSLPRLRWSSELHDHLFEAVRNLGGKYKATPKRLMQEMAVKGLQISHIKSHLQMYRSMKKSKDFKEHIHTANKPNCTIWLPPRHQDFQELISEAAIHKNQAKSTFHRQPRRGQTNHQKQVNVFYHENQEVQENTTFSKKFEKNNEISGNSDYSQFSEAIAINFWSLFDHQESQSTINTPINLDLTIS